MEIIIKWKGNKLVKYKICCLAFTSLFPFHLIIIYIIFARTSLYLMVLQVGKICVLDLPHFYVLDNRTHFVIISINPSKLTHWQHLLSLIRL